MSHFIEISQAEMVFNTKKGQFHALREINLGIEKGEFIALIGHSGCGKSTLLNLIAGLLMPSSGGLICDNREIAGPGPERAVVFQNHSLLPWLTCYQNVYLAVERVFASKESKEQLKKRTLDALELVGMSHATHKRPNEISGGMKQRVGIARALAMEPKVLLMDEPFGALDHNTRLEMQMLLLEQWQDDRMTIIFVTHDLEEACYVGTRVIGLSQYWADEAGNAGTGAIIVTDLRTPGGHPKPTAMRSTSEFNALLEQVRHEALDPENRQRLHRFNLTHQDALTPEPLSAAQVRETEEETDA